MSQFRHKLMRNAIRDRLNAAYILRQNLDESDSAYLLELLAFEILLKLAHSITNEYDVAGGHKYAVIFKKLPANVQCRALTIAEKIAPGLGIYSRHTQILETLGRNFIDQRYLYEKYDRLTEDEYRAKGAEWEARGADDEDADVIYYPTELTALTYALKQIVGMD